MARENLSNITLPAGKRHVKEQHPIFFRALCAEAKAFPGGISEIARITGKNATVLANKLNPNQLDAQPTVEDVFDVIGLADARRAVNIIARLINQVCVDIPSMDTPPETVVANFKGAISEFDHHFNRQVKTQGALLQCAAAAREDGYIDHSERNEILDWLDRLIVASIELRAVVEG